jgi:hypothetical protein
MLSGLRHALTNPATGPIATGLAVALSVALGWVSSSWQAEKSRYEARIVELSQAADRAEAGLRTQLASCEAAGQARQVTEAAYRAPAVDARSPEGARRLLAEGPEGIDACARMESADRAVLSNLRK